MAYMNGNKILNVTMTGLVNIDQAYNPESENPQSGKAVAEAIVGVEETANIARGEAGEALERVGVLEPIVADNTQRIGVVESRTAPKNYELIATIKATLDVDGKLPTSIAFTQDSNGNPFELTDFFLVMTAGCTDGNTGLYLNANDVTVIGNVTVGFKSDGFRVSTFYFNCNKDIITVSVSNSNAAPYWYSNQLGIARTLNIPLKAPTAYNLFPVTRVSVSAPLGNAKTWIDGSNFELWGVRK